jgi:hypothetical protein
MQFVVEPQGDLRCIYGEEIDLHALGSLTVARASYVEPNENGHWLVDLSPVGGKTLGVFFHRSDALAAERKWLIVNWLHPAGSR